MNAEPKPSRPAPPSGQAPMLLLVVDGLRPDDISKAHTPFLQHLRWSALIDATLEGAPGEGLWGELFAGAWPERTGALAPWTIDPGAGLPFSSRAARLLDGLDRVARWTESAPIPARLIPRLRAADPSGMSVPPPPLTPAGLRRCLKLVDDPTLYMRPGRAPLPALFDSLLAAGRRIEQTGFPLTPREERRLISRLGFMSRAFLDHHDLYVAKMPGTDRLRLQHGPGSPERVQLARDLDGLMERLVSRFRRQWPEGVVVVLGPRGSVSVRTYFDAAARLIHNARRHGLLHYRDYVILTSRTLVRAWAFSNAAQEYFQMFAGYDRHLRRYGRILTPQLAARHRLPPPGAVSGDWLWFARPGVILFPNDTDARRPKAASGYLHLDAATPAELPPARLPTDDFIANLELGDPLRSDCGVFLVSIPESHPLAGNEIRGAMRRVDVCATLAYLQNARPPAACQGRNLLEQAPPPQSDSI